MPVIDGVFVPRTPLTPAESHVDFVRIDNHVVARRLRVEQIAGPKARKIANAAQTLGYIVAAHDTLADTLTVALEQTARFGYQHAQAELRRLRGDTTVTAAANPPAQHRLSEIVRQGLTGVNAYVREQALIVTQDVIDAVMRALRAETDPTLQLLTARKAATRALHNGVLELVGATLNLGRTAGARQLEQPPRFALRSEQLDRNTCAPCHDLHGTIVQFGSPEYFAVLPPTGCLGGGRCRALMIFGDDSHHVSAPELLAA